MLAITHGIKFLFILLCPFTVLNNLSVLVRRDAQPPPPNYFRDLCRGEKKLEGLYWRHRGKTRTAGEGQAWAGVERSGPEERVGRGAIGPRLQVQGLITIFHKI